MQVDEITKKIHQLHVALRGTGASTVEIAKKINDILIFAEGIPQNLLALAWERLAAENGIAQK